MTLPQPRPNLEPLRPYTAASSVGARHSLSANEACLGPSNSAVEAAVATMQAIDRYSDGGAGA